MKKFLSGLLKVAVFAVMIFLGFTVDLFSLI